METSLSALTYEGSIPEAILESKRQKKLFVVYISGQDSDSVELEKSTWNDSKVADSVSKYCILLHIPEGSTDATNFSAIYPQKSVPSIAAIGYNGVQLWQSEGFVSAEALASNLEKAWLSLHMQETTATVLTAALASKKLEQSNSGSSDIGSSRRESSSGAVVPTASAVKHVEFADVRTPVTSETIGDDNSHGQNDEDESTKYDDRTISNSLIDKSLSVEAEQSSPTKENKEIHSPQILDPDNSVVDGVSSSIGDRSLTEEKIINQNSGFPGGDSQLVTSETNKASPDERDECMGHRKSDTIDDKERLKSPSDVHLNIRLPSGVSLQDKFSVTVSLRMVKDYVDRNQASGIGSYDLAIPYPRKVFSNEDLSKSLSELGLYNRQALIVVPHQRAMSYPRGDSSSDKTRTSNSDSSIENNGGYFASIKGMLSYFNPLSYLGGSSSSSSSGQDQTGIWEYVSPNSAIQNNSASSGRPYSSNSPNQNFSSPGRSDSRSRQPTTSRYGSNIHTLKHDEDDSRFSDKNPFWNGNSTQYGGSSDGK